MKPTIRFKLTSIISILIVVSISGMIFWATFFFKYDNEIRIQENNLILPDIVLLKIKGDIASIIGKSNLMATTMEQRFKS